MVLELRNYLWQVVSIFPICVLLLLMVKNKKNGFFLSIILDGIRDKFGFLGFQFFLKPSSLVV